jgi:hypothetical protein
MRTIIGKKAAQHDDGGSGSGGGVVALMPQMGPVRKKSHRTGRLRCTGCYRVGRNWLTMPGERPPGAVCHSQETR